MTLTPFNAQDLSLQIVEVREADELVTILRIVNVGTTTIESGWRIYFSQGMRLLDGEERVIQTQIEGHYGHLSPTEQWMPLLPGADVELKFDVPFLGGMTLKARQGFHVTHQAAPEEAEILLGRPLTEPPLLEPLTTTPNEWIPGMSPNADIHPQTPGHLFNKNDAHRAEGNGDDTGRALRLIPDVGEMNIEGSFAAPTFRIAPGQGPTADYFGSILDSRGQLDNAGLPIQFAHADRDAGYRVDISVDRILIEAGSEAGLFHGAQSLRQILDHEPGAVPILRFEDSADFGYRGFHIDIARHFVGKEQLIKTIDAMAFYKMNALQLGISNDEGWRLQIDSIPELTAIGSRRCFVESDQRDQKPLPNLYPAWGDDHEPHQGFLSTADMVEILQFAASRHVEVVLEFNLPGHANALIRSLEGHSALSVLDPADESVYRSVQGYSRNVVNVAMDSTYEAARLVLEDIARVYSRAGVPLTRIHLGGDETPDGAWLGSPICRASEAWSSDWTAENLQDVQEAHHAMMSIYYRRMTELVDAVMPGVSTGFWHEMSSHVDGPESIGRSYFNAWATENDLNGVVAKALEQGNQLVLSNASYLYLDMPYGLHHDEPGLPWASYADSESIFGFDPLGAWGIGQDRSNQILGIQAQLWSETVFSDELMDYYVFPRLVAIAERAWNSGPGEDWSEFASALGFRELPHLEKCGIQFRIPTPGAIVRDGELHANVALPGLELHYTLDRSEPTAESAHYVAPVSIGSSEVANVVCISPLGRNGRVAKVGCLSEQTAPDA